jgi:Na+-driven multidrug efflux pump
VTRAVSDARVFTGPALGTLLYYAFPSLVGLAAISTASLVDGVFVGHFVGPNALAAIGLLVPYFTFLFATALMLAAGGTVRAGRHLGEGSPAAANAVFSTSVLAVLLFSVSAALVTTAFPEVLFAVLGAPAELYREMNAYLRVATWALVPQLVGLVVYYFVRLDGRPLLATSALVGGAVANLALDALFVAGFGWGLPGAALATGLAQLVQLAVLSNHLRSGRGQLRFRLATADLRSVRRIGFAGAAEFVNEVSAGVVMLALNFLMLKRAGVEGVAAFSVVNYAVFASLMLFYGVADALHVLISQNLGARNAPRIRRFVALGLGAVGALSALFFAGAWGFAQSWAGVFVASSSQEVLGQAAALLRSASPLFLVNGLNVVLTVYLASMQQPAVAAVFAFGRTLALPLGLMLLIDAWAPGLSFVLALPLAEWTMLAAGVLLCRRYSPARCVERLATLEEREALA